MNNATAYLLVCSLLSKALKSKLIPIFPYVVTTNRMKSRRDVAIIIIINILDRF